MRIGLIQVDGKLPNLVLMKISTYYKAQGAQVEFVEPKQEYDKVFASVLFTWNLATAMKICEDKNFKEVDIGGTGYSLEKRLPDEIECCKPDYDLYTFERVKRMVRGGIQSETSLLKKAREVVDMGIGYTSRGCVRNCPFCNIREKEGYLRQYGEIKDLINPRSNVITMYDSNLTADPCCIEKLHEVRDRRLVLDISQGVDVRIMTDEIAVALSEVKHLRSLHYAWDLMSYEQQVMGGIKTLSNRVKTWRHMCFVLAGFNTTHEEDMYRAQTLISLGVSPYIMKFNKRKDDVRLNHFARWINGRFYRTCAFKDYGPWKKLA